MLQEVSDNSNKSNHHIFKKWVMWLAVVLEVQYLMSKNET